MATENDRIPTGNLMNLVVGFVEGIEDVLILPTFLYKKKWGLQDRLTKMGVVGYGCGFVTGFGSGLASWYFYTRKH